MIAHSKTEDATIESQGLGFGVVTKRLEDGRRQNEDSAVLSVVLPVFNEEAVIRNTIQELTAVLNGLENSWEVLAVDDGSTDRSAEILQDLHRECAHVKVVSFRSNFGQTAAMAAGIQLARGTVIITMDADGQNDPNEIPNLLREIANGADYVAGWRKSRQDSWSRRIPSRIANWIISRTTQVNLHDYGCSLKAFRSEIIKEVMLIGEMHRMIPILVRRNGGNVTELAVNHRPRMAGSSKYGISRAPRVMADLLVARFLLSCTSKPMHFFGKFSAFGLLVAAVSAGFATYFKISDVKDFVETPLPLLAIFSMMFACLAFLSGLLAELLVRIHFQQSGPPYKIRWTAGI